MDRYNKMDEHPPLRSYAFIGTRKEFIYKLKYLAAQAEEESWKYSNPNNNENDKEYENIGVLYQYIMHTFSRVQEENKILETKTHSICNTGLMTKNGEELFMLFEKNKNQSPEWYFKSFFRESAHEIPTEMRDKLPSHVNYFENRYEEAYFNTDYKIIGSMDHIINDNINRLPSLLKNVPKDFIITLLNGGLEVMKKRIARNNRLVLPQYYNKRIMYLAPIIIGDDIIPLAMEKHGKTYRINTILTHDMAYCNARLLMKPETNWLRQSEKTSKS